MDLKEEEAQQVVSSAKMETCPEFDGWFEGDRLSRQVHKEAKSASRMQMAALFKDLFAAGYGRGLTKGYNAGRAAGVNDMAEAAQTFLAMRHDWWSDFLEEVQEGKYVHHGVPAEMAYPLFAASKQFLDEHHAGDEFRETLEAKEIEEEMEIEVKQIKFNDKIKLRYIVYNGDLYFARVDLARGLALCGEQTQALRDALSDDQRMNIKPDGSKASVMLMLKADAILPVDAYQWHSKSKSPEKQVQREQFAEWLNRLDVVALAKQGKLKDTEGVETVEVATVDDITTEKTEQNEQKEDEIMNITKEEMELLEKAKAVYGGSSAELEEAQKTVAELKDELEKAKLQLQDLDEVHNLLKEQEAEIERLKEFETKFNALKAMFTA